MLADSHGNVVHLGERECSLQRRHQKVIEEAPSPLLDAATRARIGAAACDTARSVDYVGAGTVEFIVSADRPDEFFFMEMNTRLQVEHPVTELVTGLDLVELQLRVAAGEKLAFAQDDIGLTGHAVEARVYAEDPAAGFLPTGGTVLELREPSGDGVRVDSGSARRASWSAATTTRCWPRSSRTAPTGRRRWHGSTGRWRDTVVLGRAPPTSRSCASCSADPDVAAGRPRHRAAGSRGSPTSTRAAVDDELFAGGRRRSLAATLDRRPQGDPWDVAAGWRVGSAAPTAIRLRPRGDRTDQVYASPAPPRRRRRRVGEGESTALARVSSTATC